VSSRHCVVTQTPEGLCLVRDVSRNGTRVDGRRLVPNVESELRIGQSLDLGPGLHFVLEGEAAAVATTPPAGGRGGTEVAPQLTLATVLMGDIRDYTLMVRKAPSGPLQQSVGRVFDVMSAAVASLGGTVKEFPGDAMLAFWEGNFRGQMAVKACRAAIELERVGRKIATDPAIWAVPGYPLHMDWALATGQVSLDSFGGATTLGLSLIGEPVVLACRLEKFATDKTGSILACPNTRDMVARALREPSPAVAGGVPLVFTDLGEMQAKGFDRPDHVFAVKVPHD
jgi:class 3 adenylate cyclase